MRLFTFKSVNNFEIAKYFHFVLILLLWCEKMTEPLSVQLLLTSLSEGSRSLVRNLTVKAETTCWVAALAYCGSIVSDAVPQYLAVSTGLVGVCAGLCKVFLK